MEKYLVAILFYFLCFNYTNALAINSNSNVATQQDSSIQVLKLTKLKNDKVSYLTPGTKIKYWTLNEPAAQQGTLEGFAENALIINGKTIALSQVDRIKEKDRTSTLVWRTIGIGAGFVIAGFAIVFALISFLPTELQDERPGIVSSAIAIVFLIGSILLFKKAKKLGEKYKAEIVEISADDLEG